MVLRCLVRLHVLLTDCHCQRCVCVGGGGVCVGGWGKVSHQARVCLLQLVALPNATVAFSCPSAASGDFIDNTSPWDGPAIATAVVVSLVVAAAAAGTVATAVRTSLFTAPTPLRIDAKRNIEVCPSLECVPGVRA